MNIITFDIEEWYLDFAKKIGDVNCNRYDSILSQILDKLDEQKIKATCFCVGQMGKEFPQVVQKIADRGHEIGCHSNIHTWINKMTYEEAREDTRIAVDCLEQCIGKKVLSYRAPAFSIGESNKWAFEILNEFGIERDASVFPAKRDFGGFANFGQQVPSIVSVNGVDIKEFPIAMTHVLGHDLAYSGGGYFRFFPLNYIKNEIRQSEYSMCYFHIRDLLCEKRDILSRAEYESYFKENGSFVNRYKRYIKANLGKKGALDKLMKLLSFQDFNFVNIDQANQNINWGKTPKVVL